MLADVVLQIGQNFTGSTYGLDSTTFPADADGAVGPDHFVEFSNGRFSVYEKATGKRVQTMTDLDFWAAAGVSVATNITTSTDIKFISDPRMVFDSYTRRWMASMMDIINPNALFQKSNHFLLAVSESADPTGRWNGFAFYADPNERNVADFPTLGVDQSAVYLSAGMFDHGDNYIGSSLVSIPKSGLLAHPPDISGRTSFGILQFSARGYLLQPAITMGQPTTPEVVLAVGNLGVDVNTGSLTGPQTNLVISNFLNAGTTNATLVSPAVILSVPPYSVPINPVQPDGSNDLDDGDARFSASVRRVGDVLYAVQGVGGTNRAAIRWYRINATNSALIETGTITHPKLDLFFPSIAANESGTVVIGCNGSSADTFVSSYAVAGGILNGKLNFGNLTLLKSGMVNYHHNFNPGGINRWGDYSTTSVDPTDPSRFWTIQTIPAGTTNWATHITELMTGLHLNFTKSGTNLVISWTALTNGIVLEHSSGLAPSPKWVPLTPAPAVTVISNVATVSLPASNKADFFRLAAVSSQP
jgi:hypothetical protein